MDVLSFDIESASAEDLHRYGPGFTRLFGWQWLDGEGNPKSGVVTSSVAGELVDMIEKADAVTAHNGLNFDALAMAKWDGLDYEAAALKFFDTLVVEKHLDPVAAKGAQSNGYYTLDAVASRYGVGGKSWVDFAGKLDVVRRVSGEAAAKRLIKAEEAKQRRCERLGTAYTQPGPVVMLDLLKHLYGGYDLIPVGDPDYTRYLVMDVEAQSGVFRAQRTRVAAEDPSSQRYLRREHYVSAAMARTTLEGAVVDQDFTLSQFNAGQARLEASKQMLHERYGMPLEGKKPHTTNAGKAAFRRALQATGISDRALAANWPINKDGSLSTAKDTLNAMIESFERFGRTEAAELCRTILAMNGERTVYGTVLAHMVDGKVHPYIGPDQASGRWSMKDPGLTVLGKRGGKARERSMILADTPDEWLVAIDADQVDARVIAAECQDPEYMKLFAPGMDLHSEVAFRVWPDMDRHGEACHREPKPECCDVMAKCHCELRDRAKVFGHGFSYGLGAAGMARQHGVDQSVAEGFVVGMTQAFPRLAEWKDEIRRAAGVLAFGEEAPANDTYRILRTWAGRPVRVERNRAYTQATALIGQGGTRDVMAEAILLLPADIRRKVRAVIHDEIVVSIAAETREEAQAKAQSISDSMAFDLKGVRITFGCSRVAKSWAGCYGEQYEVAA